MSPDSTPRRSAPGAVRMRRLRQRRHQGAQVVALELYPEDVDQLAALGWLTAADESVHGYRAVQAP